jgi:ribose 5-phosphate isomerase B
MRLAVGSDHAGFPLKQELAQFLKDQGHQVTDVGTFNTAPVDYPDYAEAIGLAILNQQAERGVLLCGSGVGASVAANKMHGIRAGICHDCYSAHQGVEHDDMNVLVLGARIIGSALAHDLTTAFVAATYTGEVRHARRLAKVQAIEAKYCHNPAAGA